MQKTILITGTSSGIGRHVAIGLKERGYHVIGTVRREADRANLQDHGIETVLLDLASTSSIKQAVEEVLALSHGQIYALFNNGAYGQPGAVEDLTRDALREQFEVNLFGTQELTNQLIPLMRKQGEGRIIQNSSVLGLVAMPLRGAYNASKFALEGLSDTMRQELRGSGVYVSLIEPGPVLSDFRKNALRAFRANVDIEHSIHHERYQKTLAKLQEEGAVVPFTLGPEAVLNKVIHALESKRPQNKYYVTFPTYLFGFLKRILPDRALQALLRQV